MITIEHVVSIKTKLEEQKSKHLVLIDRELYVYTFNSRNILMSIHSDEEYFFSGCKHGSALMDKFNDKSSLDLGMYDYYIETRLEESVYISLFKYYNHAKDLRVKLNKQREILKQLI
jgi:hypothetical protein